MGKSPGKWIKGLFGKKTSKSNLSKGRELTKSASEKPVRVSSKEPISTIIVDSPIISDPVPGTITRTRDNSGFEKGQAENSATDGVITSSVKQDGDMPTVSDTAPSNDLEKVKLEQAATVVQASFRSYQARRSFQTLKGIIRLQAVVRGRLVRRQAVSTLYCVQGIVKFQAVARGRMIRQQSSNGNEQFPLQSLVAKDGKDRDPCEISKYGPAASFLKNAYIYQLLSSSPKATPLLLQYGPGEPNSAWDWLLRWSISEVWNPNYKHKEIRDSKHQSVETEQTKPKRNVRKVRSGTAKNGSNDSNTEAEKLKHKGRKLSSQPVKSAPEHPQTRSDKIKRGVKKISKPAPEISNEAGTDAEKVKRYPKKLSMSPAPKLSEQTSNPPSDKPSEDFAKSVSEQSDMKSSSDLPVGNSQVDQLNGHLASEEQSKLVSEKSQESLLVDKDFKDEPVSSENYISSRRSSLPGKYDDQEATPENVTRVPSYMATTASSKAKVKAQGSPRFALDAIDKNGLTRRYSLPSSANGKLSSSPRVHRLVQATAKEGIKIDRSLSSSRDVTDKVQAEWKR